MSDNLSTYLGLGGLVRVLCVRAEAIANEVVTRHRLSGFAAQLGAEGALATLMLSAHVKGSEQLLVQVQGSEPQFSFMGEVCADGGTRARLSPARLAPTDRMEGMLLAIKHDGEREVYRGVAPVSGPGFEAALSGYLSQSQQTWGFVRLTAHAGRSGAFTLAAGVLIERLPNLLSEEEFAEWTEPLQGLSAEELLAEIGRLELLGHPLERLETRPLQFRCPCSIERVETTLVAMGVDEIRSLHAEQGQAEVTCNFCNERYVVSGPRLLQLVTALQTAAD